MLPPGSPSHVVGPLGVAIFAMVIVLVVAAVLLYGRPAAIAALPLSLTAVIRLVQVVSGGGSTDDGE